MDGAMIFRRTTSASSLATALSKLIFAAAISAPSNGGIAASSFEIIADRARIVELPAGRRRVRLEGAHGLSQYRVVVGHRGCSGKRGGSGLSHAYEYPS